ncbi:MAG: RluA family pseudouridine synthase [Nevskiaceae bacterium]|nr:RluA family pseudouridine synthase [Nevskiaceae bacterium]
MKSIDEKQVETGPEAPDGGATRTAVRKEVLGEDDAGSRVDRVLARLLPTVPRTRLLRLLRRGEVRLNGKRVGGDARVAAGDVLRVPPVRLEAPPAVEGAAAEGGGAASKRVPPRLVEAVEASIVHQDERLLVIDKPSGIAVHGGSGIGFGVIEALRASRPDETLELVHRLDRDTSGCLLIARRRSTLRSLHALLREEAFDKRYLALLRGKWDLGTKLIDAPLRTDLRVGGERTVRVAANGKPAQTQIRPVQFFGRLATLVEVRLLTGRTHQIRVHAAYAGHPVAGDEKYGDEAFNEQLRGFGLKRLFLHAHSIGFTDPQRQVDVALSAPLPDDLKQVLDALSQRAGKLRPASVNT